MFYRCSGIKTIYGIWLAGEQPVQRCSIISPSFSATGQIEAAVVEGSIGIYIEKAKGTLVLGGEFGNYENAIEVASPPKDDDDYTDYTETSQIFGIKCDRFENGVLINEDVQKTQVFGVTSSSIAKQVVDYGNNSFAVSHQVSIQNQNSGSLSLILKQSASFSQFPLSLNVRGRLEASQSVGAGVRTYKAAGNGLKISTLDDLFGEMLAGYIGIFEDQGQNPSKTYLIVRSGGVWYSAELSTVS